VISDYVFKAKYARYNEKDKRRETWREAVARYLEMHLERYPTERRQIEELRGPLERREILPSMRGLQFGGAAVEEKHMRLYNCCASYCDRVRFFSEALWLLLAGCGVGFSVQRHHVAKLPEVKTPTADPATLHLVGDSIEGWAEATHALFSAYLEGGPRPLFDYSAVRPLGSPLRHGGHAPGPEPLRAALEGIEAILEGAAGRQLTTLEAFDCTMYLADCTRTAGTRRSATIALFSADDEDMRTAKSAPEWYKTHPQRARANISAVITPDTTPEEFSALFADTRAYGEPGFLFLESTEWAVNPCAEILMCPVYITDPEGEPVERYTPSLLDPKHRRALESEGYSFKSGWSACNLTSVNVGSTESAEELAKRARLASRLGSYQAGYTDPGYLGETSRLILEREALLGVSLCGMAERPELTTDPETLKRAAREAVAENEHTAARLGTRAASRVTTIKPEGTASLVLGTSSGIHPTHARRYLRRVQAAAHEAPFRAYQAANPHAVEVSAWGADYCAVFAMEGRGTTRDELSAVELLERARLTLNSWVKPGTARPYRVVGAHHNVSLTASVRPHEWEEVEAYLWRHRAELRGVSLLSMMGDYDYPQPPLQAVEEPTDTSTPAQVEAWELWQRIKSESVSVDYDAIAEHTDETAPLEVDACAGGACELR
jgi:ribonucleoside-triphosphate reductase